MDSQWNPAWSTAGSLLELKKSNSKKATTPPVANWHYDFLAEQTDSSEDLPNAGIRAELLK